MMMPRMGAYLCKASSCQQAQIVDTANICLHNIQQRPQYFMGETLMCLYCLRESGWPSLLRALLGCASCSTSAEQSAALHFRDALLGLYRKILNRLLNDNPES